MSIVYSSRIVFNIIRFVIALLLGGRNSLQFFILLAAHVPNCSTSSSADKETNETSDGSTLLLLLILVFVVGGLVVGGLLVGGLFVGGFVVIVGTIDFLLIK